MIHLHSGLRWIVLIGLIVAVVVAIQGFTGNKPFTDKTRKLSLIAFIGCHIQLLIGIYLWVVSGKVNFSKPMVSDLYRFFTVEHPFIMIVGIALVTIGYMKAKRAETDKQKFKSLLLFYGLGLLVILAGIPWPFREALGGGWG